MTSRTRAQLLAAIAAVCLLATACQRVEVPLYDGSRSTSLATRYVTRDGTDVYRVTTGTGGTLRVTAPSTNKATDRGSQTRAVIWPPGTKLSTDQQSCATWTDASGPWVQQGLALRVRIDGNRFRSIVVAKNLWFGAEWQLNVYTWDTARDPLLKIAGAVPLPTPFEDDAKARPLPWKVCAKVEGSTVTVKGWRPDESEPTWSDPQHTGSIQLPSGWVFQGKAGWYAGHVAPDATVGMANLRTSAWELRTDG